MTVHGLHVTYGSRLGFNHIGGGSDRNRNVIEPTQRYAWVWGPRDRSNIENESVERDLTLDHHMFGVRGRLLSSPIAD